MPNQIFHILSALRALSIQRHFLVENAAGEGSNLSPAITTYQTMAGIAKALGISLDELRK